MSTSRNSLATSRYAVYLLLAFLLSPLAAQAETITVTNLLDSGLGSLRQAITDAMSGDKIEFDSSFDNTGPRIDLTNGPLVIDKNLEICGFINSSVTLSGGGIDRARVVEITSGSTVTLTELTILNGQAPAGLDGGGILNEGNLTVESCVFTGNRAGTATGGNGGNGGAIANTGGGSLTVTGSAFDLNSAGNADTGGNGGAIFSSGGTVMITRSSFSRNVAGTGGASNGGDGGGIYTDGGSLTVVDSTLDGNEAGTGDFRGGSGGGLFSLDTTYTVTSCTFGGNKTGTGQVPADGGAICQVLGDGTISNSTICGNSLGASGSPGGSGGGISINSGSSGSFEIEGTVVAGNTATPPSTASDCIIDGNTVTISGVNCVGSNRDCETEFPAGSPNVNGDFVGTDANPLDPCIGPLADNGGPTRTMLPFLESFLIDPPGGSTTSPQSTDQRGQPRISNVIVDIGAVEVQPGEAQPKPLTTIPFAVAEAALNAASASIIRQKIEKTEKKIKKQKKKGNKAKAKKLGKKLKKLKAQLAALG